MGQCTCDQEGAADNCWKRSRTSQTPQRAFDFVLKMRWADGKVTCPRCDHADPSFIASRRIWRCSGCKKQVSLKVGTIFEDSPLGWDKWLPAIRLIANSKNSISSHELARSLGVTQKTSWFMLHRIREAMATGTFDRLSGTVEVDETFIGGLAKNMHKSSRKYLTGRGGVDKAVVQGAVQRGGDVKAAVLPDLAYGRLQGNVHHWVEPGSTVYTDEARAYLGLDGPFAHKSVNHRNEYVSGDVHTNTVENFWSLLKRALKGTQVHVEERHLHRYVNERSFAYNYRTASDLERMRTATARVAGRRLTWADLTAR